MKEDRIKKLTKELKYLPPEEISKEIEYYNVALESENADIKAIAKEIYQKRGMDYDKLNKGIIKNVVNTINDFMEAFNNKDSKIKGKMVVDILYMVILIILMKIPFNLVRDIGYDYIPNLLTNNSYYNLWHIVFLILYIITAICTLVVLIRNFNNKYNK